MTAAFPTVVLPAEREPAGRHRTGTPVAALLARTDLPAPARASAAETLGLIEEDEDAA